jgi:hypothetical protein
VAAIMTASSSDRRRALRRSSADQHGIAAARINPGKHITILNASAGGVLVETVHRLMPGAAVELHLEAQGRRTMVRGRLLRCYVASLGALSISYRAAIAFEQPLPWLTHEPTSGSIVPRAGTRSDQTGGEGTTQRIASS